MTQNNPNREKVIRAAKKVVQSKKYVIAYSKGEISKKELRERGIKLTLPS